MHSSSGSIDLPGEDWSIRYEVCAGGYEFLGGGVVEVVEHLIQDTFFESRPPDRGLEVVVECGSDGARVRQQIELQQPTYTILHTHRLN